MRHGVKKIKFHNGQDSHQALMRKLVLNFINHGKIETTPVSYTHLDVYKRQTCICVNQQVVHTPPSDRVMEDGDVVTIDAGVYLDGFHTDSAITCLLYTSRCV